LERKIRILFLKVEGINIADRGIERGKQLVKWYIGLAADEDIIVNLKNTNQGYAGDKWQHSPATDSSGAYFPAYTNRQTPRAAGSG
jgi:hypothetical protein